MSKNTLCKIAVIAVMAASVISVSGCASMNESTPNQLSVLTEDSVGEATLKTVKTAGITLVAIPASVVLTGSAILIPCDTSYTLASTSLALTGIGVYATVVNTGKTALKAFDSTIDVTKASWECMTAPD